VAIRQRPGWGVILLTLFSFGLYFVVWFGQTWSELKRIVRDPGMSPFWHALTQFVPIYNLFRVHAHFRVINAQSASRALPRATAPGLAVAGIWLALLVGRASGRIPDTYGASWLVVSGAADLLIGAILASGQRALNRVWERDFGAASERNPAAGEWIALILLGIGFALIVYSWLDVRPIDLRFPWSS
jgi:hypothetical protein